MDLTCRLGRSIRSVDRIGLEQMRGVASAEQILSPLARIRDTNQPTDDPMGVRSPIDAEIKRLGEQEVHDCKKPKQFGCSLIWLRAPS